MTDDQRIAATECCPAMQGEINRLCDQHLDRFDCPDAVIHKSAEFGYGIIIHDGGSSWRAIAFCPWCGARIGDLGNSDE